MLSKLVTRSFLTAGAMSALLAFGCAQSANRPYNLTGEQNATPEQQAWIDQHSIDQKGHWNSQLAQQAQNDVRLANQSVE